LGLFAFHGLIVRREVEIMCKRQEKKKRDWSSRNEGMIG